MQDTKNAGCIIPLYGQTDILAEVTAWISVTWQDYSSAYKTNS